MAQISVNNLTFYCEGSFDNIFENVSFSIDTDWKLGFIGRNGKGKTTFLNLLLGKYSYKGSIDAPVVFNYFPYQITDAWTRLPASEFIGELKEGCEEWRVICELTHLEESAEILYRPYHTLSFGQQTKIMLAVLFSGENNFLQTDEPTNHLDQNSREQVKSYLASKKGFILVSHDRDLLDACADHILTLNRQSIEVRKGNFSSWWENKQKQDQFEQAENEKHLKEIKTVGAACLGVGGQKRTGKNRLRSGKRTGQGKRYEIVYRRENEKNAVPRIVNGSAYSKRIGRKRGTLTKHRAVGRFKNDAVCPP